MEIRKTRYDHPDAAALIGLLQQEYVRRYGDGDRTPVDPAHFAPPQGDYLLVYDADGQPVASGGWRAQDSSEPGFTDGDAELKRMFVVPEARGRGLARVLLAELEASATAAGRRRMVLETGQRQPEAIALYGSCGYTPVPGFGYYADEEESVHLGKALGPLGDSGGLAGPAPAEPVSA